MSKRIWFVISSVLFASIFSGCGFKDSLEPDAGGKPEKQVIIEYFSGIYDENAVEGLNKYIIEPFEQRFPSIKIEWQQSADWNNILKTQMAASKGPDLIELEGPSVVLEYAAYSRLYDITPYIEEYGWDKMIFPWALDSCKINGKLMALPISYEALVLWYNEDILNGNGWEVPRTYTELKTIADECMQRGLIPFAFGSYNIKESNEWWISMMLNSCAGKDNLRELLGGRLKWTDEPVREAISILVNIWRDGWLNARRSHLTSNDDSNVLFLHQKAIFKMEGTWLFGRLTDNRPDFAFNMTTFPSMKNNMEQSIPMGIGSTLSINAKTRYVNEIAEFLNFYFANKQNHIKAIEEYGMQIMPVEYELQDFSENMDPVQKNMLRLLEETNKSNSFGYCLWTFFPPETRRYLIDNIEKVYMNSLPLNDYLNNVQQIFEMELSAKKVPYIP